MRKVVFILAFILIFLSCKDKKENNLSVKASNIPSNALLIDKYGSPIPLPKDKLIILNFMAYSCSACMEEIPILKKVLKEKEYKDKFKLIFIAIDAEKNDLSDKDFPVYSNNRKNFVRFPVPGTPTTYIITPKGKKLVYIVGAVTEENLREFLKQALKKYKGAKKPQ